MPPPPQVAGAAQATWLQSTVPPQPSGRVPTHSVPQACAAVFAEQPHTLAVPPPPQVSTPPQSPFILQAFPSPQVWQAAPPQSTSVSSPSSMLSPQWSAWHLPFTQPAPAQSA